MIRNILISYFTLFFLLSFTAAYTPPSSLSKFRQVIEYGKLQAPDAKTNIYDLKEYANEYFSLEDNKYIKFRIRGELKRSELREMRAPREEAEWSPGDSHTMKATLSIPKQESAIREITFLQIHCTKKPALRISWIRSFKKGDLRCNDCVVAHVRTGLGKKDVDKYILGKRPSSLTNYVVHTDDGQLTVTINGKKVLDVSLKYWVPNICYFKAGAYLQHPENDSDWAVTKFYDLTW